MDNGGVSRRRARLHLQAPPRGQVAGRDALHRRRRRVHLEAHHRPEGAGAEPRRLAGRPARRDARPPHRARPLREAEPGVPRHGGLGPRLHRPPPPAGGEGRGRLGAEPEAGGHRAVRRQGMGRRQPRPPRAEPGLPGGRQAQPRRDPRPHRPGDRRPARGSCSAARPTSSSTSRPPTPRSSAASPTTGWSRRRATRGGTSGSTPRTRSSRTARSARRSPTAWTRRRSRAP